MLRSVYSDSKRVICGDESTMTSLYPPLPSGQAKTGITGTGGVGRSSHFELRKTHRWGMCRYRSTARIFMLYGEEKAPPMTMGGADMVLVYEITAVG